MNDETVSYDDIAAILGVKTGTVRVWHNRKLLPEPVIHNTVARINHRPRWDREQILRWAQNTGRHTDAYRQSIADGQGGSVVLEPRPGAETGFEREMRLAREAARK